MRTQTKIAFLPLLLATALSAQTQLVRGDVDVVKNTTNVFRLDCTNILLTSRTVNLLQLHNASRQQDIEYEMQVRDVSSGGQAILDVVSAKTIKEMFNMGNIRIGRSDTWEVFGPAGSPTAIFITLPVLTSYAPFGNAGTWLLGATPVMFAQGTVSAIGRFQVRYQPPNIPSLVGQTVVGQAALIQSGALVLTNADCKEVRSK